MNIHEKIINIRVELQNSKIKKSGKNTHAGFEYFELSDFLPKVNELLLKYKLNDQVIINNELARLIIFDSNGEGFAEYTIPFKMFSTPVTSKGNQMMQDIQYLGAINTYYKRYLYMNAFGITDGEVIDSLDNSDVINPKEKLESLYNQKKSKLDPKLKTRIEEILVTEEVSAYQKTIKHLQTI